MTQSEGAWDGEMACRKQREELGLIAIGIPQETFIKSNLIYTRKVWHPECQPCVNANQDSFSMMRTDFKSRRNPERVGFTQDGQCIYGDGNEAVRDECAASLGCNLFLFCFVFKVKS